MSDIIAFLVANGVDILEALLSIVGGASILAAITPTAKDDSVLSVVRKVLDLVAANVGNAKNKDAE